MQIFELHFNPKLKNDCVFDSFIYEPTNSYEKNLGSLLMVGEITNAVINDANLLARLSESIKKKYYSFSNKSPFKAISESLKEGNNFLSEEIKRENVSWLGNLNFSVFCLKDFNLNFTSTGNLKIMLIRGGQISDIGKNIDAKEIEPYPLKIFFNVVSGKLMENDILLVMTEKIFNFLTEENMLHKISQTGKIDEKKLKDIFPQKIFNEKNISGICFIASLRKDENRISPYQKAKEMIFEKPKESFLAIASKKAQKMKNYFKKVFTRSPSKKKISVKINKGSFLKISQNSNGKNKLVLIGAFIGLLLIGFLVFKKDIETKQNETLKEIEKIEEKLKEENIQSSVLMEDLNKINGFLKDKKSPYYDKAAAVKESIEKKLELANKLERIENPESYIDLNPDKIGFLAHNISFSNSVFYFSSSVSKDLYLFNKNKNSEEKIKGTYEFSLDDDLSDFVLFFSKPNNILHLSEQEIIKEEVNVSSSYDFFSFSSYNLNLYFLDGNKNEIVKYPYLGSFQWNGPETTIKSDIRIKSFAIDGFIWLLNEKNEIESYYKGEKKKTINLDIFPIVKNLTKIGTRAELPYLYISEPINNRLIVIDKNGNLIKQFQSDKFDNIKDFTASYDGETIWLLNGSDVFELKI